MAEPTNNIPNHDYCINKSRLTAIETKMKHKRYELNDLHERISEQEKNMDRLVQEVTKLATLLQETQKSRTEHSNKIDSLENQVTQFNATMNTLKWVITVAIALFGGVIVFMVTNLIQIIH